MLQAARDQKEGDPKGTMQDFSNFWDSIQQDISQQSPSTSKCLLLKLPHIPHAHHNYMAVYHIWYSVQPYCQLTKY